MTTPIRTDEAIKVFRVAGTTDDVTTCEQCGREDLKATVIMVELDADGNDMGPVYMGSDCAARATKWTQSRIRSAAYAADREAKRQAMLAQERRRQEERKEFEAAFSDWLLETYGTRDEEAVIRRLDIGIRYKLIKQFREARKP